MMPIELSAGLKQKIQEGVALLKNGGVIAYPTDTVYGLGAGMEFRQAVERVYQIKERPMSMPLPLLIADIDELDNLTEAVSETANILIKQFWPGGLTLVFNALPAVPEIITAGAETVAIRIPAHPMALALIRGLGMPLVGTSANLSGKASALTADEVAAQVGDRIDMVVDGGRCPGGIESTIIDVSGEKPKILRAGAVTEQTIERMTGIIFREEP